MLVWGGDLSRESKNAVLIQRKVKYSRTAVESVNTQDVIAAHTSSSTNLNVIIRNGNHGWLIVPGESFPKTTYIKKQQ